MLLHKIMLHLMVNFGVPTEAIEDMYGMTLTAVRAANSV